MPLVPPRVGYAIFTRLGNFAYSKSAASRENVHHNLRHVLGPEADPVRIEEVARQVFMGKLS